MSSGFRYSVRVTAEEHRRIEDNIRLSGMTKSDYLKCRLLQNNLYEQRHLKQKVVILNALDGLERKAWRGEEIRIEDVEVVKRTVWYDEG